LIITRRMQVQILSLRPSSFWTGLLSEAYPLQNPFA
jgi:hypothetical protein